MAKKESEYQRLPGKGLASEGFFTVAGSKSRLYMGGDHILRLNSSVYTEKYRRFYFTDIQAVIICLTDSRMVWNALHLAFCAAFIIWLLVIDSAPWRVVLGCIALFFGVKFLINALRGPTCLTRIQTRIGVEPLPSLQRARNARKVLDLLKPHIQAAQGNLSPDEIPRRFAEFGAGVSRQSGSAPKASPHGGSQPQENSYRGGLHGLAFGLFVIEAAVLAMNIVSPGALAAMLVLLATFATAGLTIVSLVKQGRSALGPAVRTVTWFALIHVILCFIGGYVLMIATSIQHPRMSNDQTALFTAMSEIQTPWIHDVYIFMAGYALVVALAGLITLLGSRVPAAEASSQL